MGTAHDGAEPTVGRGEIRSHEIVVVQIAAVVITHSSSAALVVKAIHSPIMGGGIDKSVQLRWEVSGRVVQAPIDVRFIPGRARVFRALRQ